MSAAERMGATCARCDDARIAELAREWRRLDRADMALFLEAKRVEGPHHDSTTTPLWVAWRAASALTSAARDAFHAALDAECEPTADTERPAASEVGL